MYRRVVASALRSFSERGFHGTAIPDIARDAGVGVASIYRRFESKEHLVNAVFRETKARLRDAIFLGLDLAQPADALFRALWSRLVAFQRTDPVAFQFLEMQDHVPYLDHESRALEASLLAPIFLHTQALTAEAPCGVPAAIRIAMVWGAFVGITKAERLGYFGADDEALARAGELAFVMLMGGLASGASGASGAAANAPDAGSLPSKRQAKPKPKPKPSARPRASRHGRGGE